jgi:hypothetical protein
MSIVLDGTTGITTPDGDVYAEGNILGTVSESGGVPTGAIIESGSNANGEFVKYADGTMICTQGFPQETSTTWTYPVAFASAPRIQATNTVGNLPRFCSVSGPSTTSVVVYRWTDTGTSSASFAHALAIGRWF